MKNRGPPLLISAWLKKLKRFVAIKIKKDFIWPLRKPRRASPKIFLDSKKKFQIQLILSNPDSYFLWNLQISVKCKTIFEIAKLLSNPKKKNVLNPTKLLGVRKYFSKPGNLFQPNIYFLVHKSFFKSKKISQIRKSFSKSRKIF